MMLLHSALLYQVGYRHSLYFDLSVPLSLSLFLSVSSALLVCPAVKACILVTIGWILMKLGESVGTSVRLIVSKFHKNRVIDDIIIMSY